MRISDLKVKPSQECFSHVGIEPLLPMNESVLKEVNASCSRKQRR